MRAQARIRSQSNSNARASVTISTICVAIMERTAPWDARWESATRDGVASSADGDAKYTCALDVRSRELPQPRDRRRLPAACKSEWRRPTCKKCESKPEPGTRPRLQLQQCLRIPE